MAILFVVASALVAYVFFGYPVLLGLLSRRRVNAIQTRFAPRKVTVLLAVRNAEQWIRAKLQTLHDMNYPLESVDILVISDGSDDSTDEQVRAFGSPNVRLIRIPKGGKAKALNAGLEAATGEILFFTDVRQPLDRQALRYLVECFHDPRVGAVSGELMIRDGHTNEETDVGLYWKYEKWIRKRQSAIDSVIGATGCIYAMRRELAVKLPDDCLLDDVYQPLEAFFRGYRVLLDERAKAYDQAVSLDTEFRRKVRTLAGNYQLLWQRPELLSGRNRMLLHFLSHKVGRLLAPWALIAIALSTAFLAEPWNWIAATGQVGIYGLAIVDRWLPERFFLKRLSSPARIFVVLMVATVLAVSIFFRPSAGLWKTTPSPRR